MRDRCRSRTGVALSARGPEVAGCCPASDRRRLAGHGAGLSACPSSGPSARVAPAAIRTDRGTCVWRGFRHGPWQAASGPPCPPQARPGDTPLARPFGLARNEPGPVAGFPPAPRGLAPRKPVLPAEPRWPPPPEACRATSARPAPGIPSHLHRNVRDPSGSGSAGIMAWGWRVWKKKQYRPIYCYDLFAYLEVQPHYNHIECMGVPTR